MPSQSTYSIFAQTAPGLEPLLKQELDSLGVVSVIEVGGVKLRGSQSDLWRLCLESRLSESIRIRLKPFEAKSFGDLQSGLRKLPFRAFLEKGSEFRVKVVCHQSRLYHSGAVHERASGVLEDFVGLKKTDNTEGCPCVYIRLMNDEVQVSLDASGERMHRRGYRSRVETASVRETLAAALLQVALAHAPKNSEGPLTLWDPFCGAGTIPLEVAHTHLRRLAGALRCHAFQAFRGHDEEAFQAFKAKRAQAKLSEIPPQPLAVWGTDHSERAIQAAEHNGAEADLNRVISWRTLDVEKAASQIPSGALVVTNPPYGKRLTDTSAITQLLRVLKERSDLGPAFLLVGGAARDALPTESRALFRTKNGGFSVSARMVTAT